MAQSSANLVSECPPMPGYRIERELNPGQSWLAEASSGRRVVLKKLDEDCLLKGQLHPLIRDRLARVRELAHLGVANLCSVERCDAFAYLVWEYVEGQTLGEFLASRAGSGVPRALGYELAVCVESLHALGLAHGAVHDRNIIVTPSGSLRLTHVSPLLYTDLSVDVDATVYLLGEMGCEAALKEIESQAPSLREVAAHLAAFAKGAANPANGSSPAAQDDGSPIRRRARWGAAMVALIGLSVAVGAWQWARHVEQVASEERLRLEDASAHAMPASGTHDRAFRISEAGHDRAVARAGS